MNLIKVAKLGQRVVEVALDNGATVADAIAAAEVDDNRTQLRINGSPAEHDSVVTNGDIVTLIPSIKGGV